MIAQHFYDSEPSSSTQPIDRENLPVESDEDPLGGARAVVVALLFEGSIMLLSFAVYFAVRFAR